MNSKDMFELFADYGVGLSIDRAVHLHDEDEWNDYTISYNGTIVGSELVDASAVRQNIEQMSDYISTDNERMIYWHGGKDPYELAALVAPTGDGVSYDSFVLLDTRHGETELVGFFYGIDALNRTEEDILRFCRNAVEEYRGYRY